MAVSRRGRPRRPSCVRCRVSGPLPSPRSSSGRAARRSHSRCRRTSATRLARPWGSRGRWGVGAHGLAYPHIRHAPAECDTRTSVEGKRPPDETDESEVPREPPYVSHFSCGSAATYGRARARAKGPLVASYASRRSRVKVERPDSEARTNDPEARAAGSNYRRGPLIRAGVQRPRCGQQRDVP